MKLLDVNIVVIAHRKDHPDHGLVRPWFDALVGSDRQFTVPDVVWSSFVRLVTNLRIMDRPTPAAQTFDFVHAVCAQPRYVEHVPGGEHLAIFERLCLQFDAIGDLVPDAYLAALAIEQGCTLVSLDRDFARFEGLDWERPG